MPTCAQHTVIRRLNAWPLLPGLPATRRIAAGQAPKGLEQAFAARLQISPSMWSQIKSSRPIGDKLARQIEQHTGQAEGWLDEDHGTPAPEDPAEQRFLDLARAAWRASNAKRKRELAKAMRDAATAA